MGEREGHALFGFSDIRFLIFSDISLYSHNIDHRLMKFDMNDLQDDTEDFHYSDIRISGFGFFRIFSLYGQNIDPRLMKFGMNDLQCATEDFHYPDIWISGFGFFHFTATILILDL